MQQVDRMIVVGLGVLVFSACSSPPAQVTSVASIQAQASAAVAPHPPPPKTCRDPAAGALASGPLGIRPLEVECRTICLDARALCPAPLADRQLDLRLLAAGAQRLDVGRGAVDLVSGLPGLPREQS